MKNGRKVPEQLFLETPVGGRTIAHAGVEVENGEGQREIGERQKRMKYIEFTTA